MEAGPLILCLTVGFGFNPAGRTAEPKPAAGTLHELKDFRVLGTVLHVGAHPDSSAFPEQLRTLTPWQPRHIFVNGRGSGPGVQMDVGGTDPVTGESFGGIAAKSRAMHKTQGFGGAGALSA